MYISIGIYIYVPIKTKKKCVNERANVKVGYKIY